MQPMSSSSMRSEVHDPEQFRQLGHDLIDLLADHLQVLHTDPTKPVIPYRDPATELAFWQADFAQGTGDPLVFFQQVLDHSIQLHHPHYIGHQVSVPALISCLAGMVSDFLSNGTGVYEMGMAANAIERVVTDFTAQKIGFTDAANGMITSGGTLANLTALLAARSAKAPGSVWEDGHGERLAIMVSEEAHYCIDRAARILGMGSEGIIKIPVDEQFKIRVDVLDSYYQAAVDKGWVVIALVGCAGSTATGSYDDLTALGTFCAKHQLWFHVDGAHGGAVVFSEKYRHLTAGIELADTVVIDYHKMLLTPALSTGLIFKNGEQAYQTFAQRAQYLWEVQQTQEWFQSGKRTFECTKLMLSIKVYAILRTYGASVFAENVDRLYEQAQVFAHLIEAHPDFELAIYPESNIVNFRHTARPRAAWDLHNAQIRQNLVHSGDFYIVQTVIKGERFLRASVMNPLTNEGVFRALLDRLSGMV